MVKIKSNKPQVMQRFAQAFAQTAQAYDANLHQVIRLKRGWPRGFGITHRRSGQVVVGSHRNIYDTGALDRSQQMTPISRFRVRYSWSAPYATTVHEGATLKSGYRIPARRFTRVAAKEADLPARFAGAFKEAG